MHVIQNAQLNVVQCISDVDDVKASARRRVVCYDLVRNALKSCKTFDPGRSIAGRGCRREVVNSGT